MDKKWEGEEEEDGKELLKRIYSSIFICVMGTKLGSLPTFSDMIHYNGPYVGLVLSLIIATLILQYIWFQKVIKAKNEEIKRLANREEQLNDRVLYMISKEIGIRKSDK